MFDGRWRASVEQGLQPVGSGLRRVGLRPDHLTLLGLVAAAGCAVAIGNGRLGLGVALLIAAAVPDLLDGAVARATGGGTARGAFFDSVSDRVADALLLGGVAWYLTATRGGHVALLPFAVLAVSMLISYERARGEALGFDARGGLMERAERLIALGIGLAFSTLLVPILWVMLALSSVTAVHRFARVWRQASAPRPIRADGRWRTWRDAAGIRASLRTARGHRGNGRTRIRGRSRTRP